MKIVFLVCALFANNAYSDCYVSLSGGLDSKNHQINVSTDSPLQNKSEQALKKLFKKLNCQEMEIGTIKCNTAIKDVPETEICYTECQYGYFLISKDYLDNINILFNRWD